MFIALGAHGKIELLVWNEWRRKIRKIVKRTMHLGDNVAWMTDFHYQILLRLIWDWDKLEMSIFGRIDGECCPEGTWFMSLTDNERQTVEGMNCRIDETINTQYELFCFVRLETTAKISTHLPTTHVVSFPYELIQFLQECNHFLTSFY